MQNAPWTILDGFVKGLALSFNIVSFVKDVSVKFSVYKNPYNKILIDVK